MRKFQINKIAYSELSLNQRMMLAKISLQCIVNVYIFLESKSWI